MKNLIKLREKKGLRQIDIANEIGMSRQAYCSYENGNRQPDFETLKKLSEYFEVSVDYLIGNTDNPFKPLEWTEKEKALGVGNHAVKLSEKDKYRFHVLARAEEILGVEFVDAQIKLLEIATNNQENK